MHKQNRLLNKLIILLLIFVIDVSMPAMAYDYSADVIKFQRKLASKGDVSAQYKLGVMYEAGEGTEVDLNEALKWYQKSAAQGHDAASRRISYIDILTSGYKADKHQQWLNNLKQDASGKDGDAMLLLGMMYKNGTVVRKDINLAEELFKQAVIKDISGAEGQLESIFVLMEAERESELALKKKQLAIEKADFERKKNVQREARLRKRYLEKQQEKIARKQKETARNRKELAMRAKVKPEKAIVKKTEPVKKKPELSWTEAVKQQNE